MQLPRARVEGLEPRQLFAAAIPSLYPVYSGATLRHGATESLAYFNLTVESQNPKGKIAGHLDLTQSATGQIFHFSFTGSVKRNRTFVFRAAGDGQNTVVLRGKVEIDAQFGAPRTMDGVFRSKGNPIQARGTFAASSPLAPV
jgi:hypothetical protein